MVKVIMYFWLFWGPYEVCFAVREEASPGVMREKGKRFTSSMICFWFVLFFLAAEMSPFPTGSENDQNKMAAPASPSNLSVYFHGRVKWSCLSKLPSTQRQTQDCKLPPTCVCFRQQMFLHNKLIQLWSCKKREKQCPGIMLFFYLV